MLCYHAAVREVVSYEAGLAGAGAGGGAVQRVAGAVPGTVAGAKLAGGKLLGGHGWVKDQDQE